MPRFLRNAIFHTPTNLLHLRRKDSTELGLVDNTRIGDDRYDRHGGIPLFETRTSGDTALALVVVSLLCLLSS